MKRRAFSCSRRVLMAGGGAALALPWLEAMTPRRAYAQTAALPLRFVVMFSANGTVAKDWTPSGGETDFQLSPILAPLAPHRDDLILVQGLEQQGGGGDGHQNGMGGMLTGQMLNPGHFAGGAGGSSGWAAGISVDQRIAQAVGSDTRFRSLELGVQVGAADNRARMSYGGSDQPLPPEDDPDRAFARVFADSMPEQVPGQREKQRAHQKSVLDRVAERYARVAAKLGTDDRRRLLAHLEAIREIELRIDREPAARATCRPLAAATPSNLAANDAFPALGKLQTDLMVMALSCDLTRVASLQWSRSVSPVRFSWLGIPEAHHDLSHMGDDNADAQDKLTRINRWYAQQLAYLIAALKAVPEGEGTLFDNTLILWCNELAKGNVHSRKGAMYVLAGRAGGALRTGRYLTYPGNIPHNNLLLSLLNAMGVADTSFGKAEWCTGPLAHLL